MTQRPPLIAVCGASDATQRDLQDARRCGELLAEAGAVVINGGLGGVMAACAEGVASSGGTCIGILPGVAADDANEHVTVAIPTGMGEVRNTLITRSAAGIIAIGGGWGTLSEIAFAMRIAKPVVLLHSWNVGPPEDVAPTGMPPNAATAEDAVRLILSEIQKDAEESASGRRG